MTSQGPEHPEAGEPRESGAPSPEGAEGTEGTEGTDIPDVPDDLSGLDEAGAEVGAGNGPDEPAQDLESELAERTLDLQRLQAEFLNYKRRVDRDRELVKQNAVFSVLTPMLDVLDSIDRAREAGELEGGFKGVADQLERVVAGLGLHRFGEPGDAFDPNMHDALSHLGSDPEVSVVTVKHVAKGGYRIGERVVRAAQVLVVDPAEGDQD